MNTALAELRDLQDAHCDGCTVGSDNRTEHEVGCRWTRRVEGYGPSAAAAGRAAEREWVRQQLADYGYGGW